MRDLGRVIRGEFAELRELLIPPNSPLTTPVPELLENVIRDPLLTESLVQKVEGRLGAGLYSWATDPGAYDTAQEWSLQVLVLAALSEIPADHQSLRGHRPIVVRVLDGVDYNSTNVRSKSVDFIIIGAAHFVLLREVAHLMVKLAEVDIGDLADEPDRLAAPFAGPLMYLIHTDCDAAVELFKPLQRLVVAFDDVESPVASPPLTPRLLDGSLPREVVMSIFDMYNGADAFVLFHELAHLLNGDQHGSARSLRQELVTDRSALSIAIAANSAVKDVRSLTKQMLIHSLRVGGPALLQIFRCVQLIGTSYRVAAQLADQALSHWEGTLAAEYASLQELESRLIGLRLALESYRLKEIADEVGKFAAAYEALVVGTKALLLAKTGQKDAISDIRGLNVAAAERAGAAIRDS